MKFFITLVLVALCTLPSRVIQATPQSRDNWRSVRTNHLFVIGNAEAENLRQVAVWLEFFHRAFGRIVSRNVIDSSVPTTVIGFRDDASFRPFKPLYQGRSLPTVDEVLSKYVEAMGGAKAINAVTSRVTKGTVDLVGVSRGGSFEIYELAPNKTLSVMQAHPIGTIKLGFNGRSGWARTVAGLRTLKGLELASLQRHSDFYSLARLKNNYPKVTLAGKSKIGFRDVYVVDLQPAAGPVERLYLDAQTFLPVRLNTVKTNGTISAPVEVYYDDWREIDGIKFPFSISESFPKLTFTLNIKEIRHNVPLDARMFEP